MTEEECLSMKYSRNSTYSVIVLCVKRPPAIMSRHRLACVLIPKQKHRSNMLSGKDKSGLVCNNTENLAQAAPVDSFLRCSKSRIALGWELIWDIGKNEKVKLVFKFILVPIHTFYGMCVPLLCLRREREGKQFPL